MNVIIDANVFRAFYEEDVLGHASPRPGRTASPVGLFVVLGKQAFSYIDTGQQLEHEWREVCKGGEEWFDGWLANAYLSGGVTPIEVDKSSAVERRYRNLGFPAKSRDIWYIRVAVSVTSACSSNSAYLISEDIDFYDPAKKKDASREMCIQRGLGPVAKQLRRDGVTVCCIGCCVASLT